MCAEKDDHKHCQDATKSDSPRPFAMCYYGICKCHTEANAWYTC